MSPRFCIVLLCQLLIVSCQLLRAQVDTEFWLAVPYLTDAHSSSQALGKGKLCITSFDQAATVVVSQPAVTKTTDPFYFAPTTLNLAAHQSVDLSVGSGNINRAKAFGPCPYGFHITSDAPIAVYYAQVNENSEIYTYKGSSALGTSFLVGMQRDCGNAFSAASSIDILATEDNTVVSITPPAGVAVRPGTSLTALTLNKGQIFTLQSQSASAAGHLGGTIITSNKPVCVNSNDDSAASTGQDLVGDQIVPADLAGREYIAIKHSASNQRERLYLYTFPSRPITFQVGNGTLQTLAGGSSTTIDLTAQVTYIHADDDFVCFQLTGVGGELGGTVLPRLDCTGSSQVTFKKRFTNQDIAILVRTAYTGAFRINGQVANLLFNPVPNAPSWSYATLTGSSFASNGVISIENTQSVFHASILDHGGGTCSYGYFSGYNHVALFPMSDKAVYQSGETVTLSLSNSALFTNIVWTFPDGTTHAGDSVSFTASSSAQSGTYTVTAESREECEVTPASCTITVNAPVPPPPPDTVPGPPPVEPDSFCTKGRTLLIENFGGNDAKEPMVRLAPVPSTSLQFNQVFSVAPGELSSGDYIVTKRGAHHGVGSTSDWLLTSDHTYPGDSTMGYFLEIDRTKKGTVLYEATVQGLTPDSSMSFSAYVANVSYQPHHNQMPVLGFRVKDLSGKVIANALTGPLPFDATATSPRTEATWYQHGVSFVVPAGVTTCVFQIYDFDIDGNEWCGIAIDDIFIIECGTEDPPAPPATLSLDMETRPGNICDGDSLLFLRPRLIAGTPHLCYYSITSPTSGAKLLADTFALDLPSFEGIPASNRYFDIALPVLSLDPNRYSCTISFLDTVNQLKVDLPPFAFTVLYDPEGIFAQKWDNVLAIFSPQYSAYHLTFTPAYQWYRNGVKIDGATGSYYRLEDAFFSLTDYYQVEVTREQDGVMLLTCPYYPHVPEYESSSSAPAAEKVMIGHEIFILVHGATEADDRLYRLDGLRAK